jgi:phosphatidylinositol dimannoside acyltransferase
VSSFTYRVGIALAGLLPEVVVRVAGETAGRFAFDHAGRRAHMSIRHMARALGSEQEVEAAARQAFGAYGRYWAEAFWVRPRRVRGILEHIERDGVERAEAARDAGTGMIFALPHIGNWEVAGTVAHDLGLELIAVAESLPDDKVVEWFIELRRQLGIDVVLANDGNVMQQLGAALDRGAAVALVMDRNVKAGGVEVEFFGERTSMPAGAAALGLAHEVPVFPVAAYFKKGRGHVLVVEKPVALPEIGSRQERVVEGTRRIATALEDLIRRAPTQWHIVQPNWPSDRRAR